MRQRLKPWLKGCEECHRKKTRCSNANLKFAPRGSGSAKSSKRVRESSDEEDEEEARPVKRSRRSTARAGSSRDEDVNLPGLKQEVRRLGEAIGRIERNLFRVMQKLCEVHDEDVGEEYEEVPSERESD